MLCYVMLYSLNGLKDFFCSGSCNRVAKSHRRPWWDL